jgi:hypothetical protein
LLEGFRVQRSQHPTERVVAGDPVLQLQELPQQLLLGASKQRHVGRTLRPAQHSGQRDDQNVEQFVQRIRCSRVAQPLENPGELLHWTPLAIRESFSESILPVGAT